MFSVRKKNPVPFVFGSPPMFSMRSVSAAALAGFLALGCGERQKTEESTAGTGADDVPGESRAVSGEVTLAEAEESALEAVGVGRVTWSGPEDDRGAAWEVEVTRPNGTEVDVLVAADGSIVKLVEKYGEGPPLEGMGQVPASGVVSRQLAEEAALRAVGEGRVTWVGREDERGAAWEVEITRPDGTEMDVLIAPDGSVIR